MKKLPIILLFLFFLSPVVFHNLHVNADNNGQNGTTLSATKTATGHFTRTFDWTIEKSVTPESWDLFIGDSGTSRYTVSVTKDNGTDSAYVDGQVCVTNGGGVATEGLTIFDDILTKPQAGQQFQDSGFSKTLDVSEKPMLNPGESHCYPYSIPFTPVTGNLYKNEAQVTITNHSGSLGEASGPDPKADFSIPSTPTIFNNEINADDTNGQSWSFSDSGSETYDTSFTCTELRSDTHPNTATIRETGDSASALVTVNCFDPTVTKTTHTSFDRTYNWSIHKSADQSSLTLALNEPFTVNYSVSTDASSSDSNWQVSGIIDVYNSAPIDAVINSVSDVVSGDIPVEVDCGVTYPHTILAGDTLHCTYSTSLPNADSRINTAKATQQNYSYDFEGNPTPKEGEGSTTEFSGTANVDFSSASINDMDKCITINDTLGGSLGSVCYNELPKTFTYSSQIGPFATCGPRTVPNTATFTTDTTETSGSSSWNVNVNTPCVLGCTLTIGYWKNHAGFGPQINMVTPLLTPSIYLGTPPPPKSILVANATIARDILNMNGTYGTPSNGVTKLYAQLLGAKLNIRSGASATFISPTIIASDTFLTNNDWNSWTVLSKAQKNLVLSWMTALDNYNNGLSGVPHCSQ